MKVLFLGIAWVFALLEAGWAEEVEEPKIPKLIQESAFCVVYELRDVDDRDTRPIPEEPGGCSDPFAGGDGEERIQGQAVGRIGYSVVLGRQLDVAALLSRTIGQKLLKPDQIQKLNRAAFGPSAGADYPRAACYDPHHVFVYYDFYGNPQACIELCFSCNQMCIAYDLRPKEEGAEGFDSWPLVEVPKDYFKLAEICADAGLGLGGYESLESFKTSKRKYQERLKKELGAAQDE